MPLFISFILFLYFHSIYYFIMLIFLHHYFIINIFIISSLLSSIYYFLFYYFLSFHFIFFYFIISFFISFYFDLFIIFISLFLIIFHYFFHWFSFRYFSIYFRRYCRFSLSASSSLARFSYFRDTIGFDIIVITTIIDFSLHLRAEASLSSLLRYFFIFLFRASEARWRVPIFLDHAGGARRMSFSLLVEMFLLFSSFLFHWGLLSTWFSSSLSFVIFF